MVHDIFVKVKLEVTRTSTVLNVFGSRWSSDVTRSIFCPNFCKMVTSMLQLDLMNLFVKAWVWFNPIIQGMAIRSPILRQNFIETKDSGVRMLCMENVIMKLRCPKKHHFLVSNALGTMLNHFVLLFFFCFLEMGLWSQHGRLMVPNICN